MTDYSATTGVVEALELERDTLLRVLRSTLERHHTAEDIRRQAAGYRRKHPIRSRIFGVPAESKLADPARLVAAVKGSAVAPATGDVLASIFRNRAVSEADLKLLTRVTAIDELLRALASVDSSHKEPGVAVHFDEMHPLYPQWREAIENATRRKERTSILRSRHVVGHATTGLVMSVPAYFALLSSVGVHHPLVLATIVLFAVSALALVPFAIENDLGGRFWPERLAKRCATLNAGAEIALLATWHHEDRISKSDIDAIERCLSIREAMGSALYSGGSVAQTKRSAQPESPRGTTKRSATNYAPSDSSIHYH